MKKGFAPEIEKKKQDFQEDKITHIARIIALFGLVYTFLLISYTSIWFFILFVYFHQLNYISGNRFILVLKSIFYPLLFLFFISFVDWISHGSLNFSNLFYFIGKHSLSTIIGIVLMLITQLLRYPKSPKFSLKQPLFWLSLICLIIGTMSYIVDLRLKQLI